MTISRGLTERLRTSALKRAATQVALKAYHAARDLTGSAQLALGHDLTVAGSARVALEQWKIALRDVPEPRTGQLLFAAIRNRRWVEWAVYSACYAVRLGYKPVVLYSGAKIAQLYGSGRNHFFAAARILPHFDWVDLDPLMTVEGATEFDDFALAMAHTVAAYDLRVEEREPQQAPDEYERVYAAAVPMLRRYAAAADRVLALYPDRRLICPSGLIGESLSFYEVARRRQHEAIYVEGWALRPGHNIWNLNRPALEYDLDGWLRSLGGWSAELERDARDYMAFREGQKIDRAGWLDNFHRVQRSSKEKPLPLALETFLRRPGPLALLGTNVVGDSSTLRRQTILRSQQAWLEVTIAFFKQHPEWNLLIRAHPDEVWVKARLRMAELARQYASDASNIYIIGSEEDVNTYALIDAVDLGLAWVSNIGLDMALRGKPVVMGARPKYTGLGVVHEPASVDEYLNLISQLIVHPIGPDAASIQRGKAYHHIVFKLLSLEADDRQYNSANYRLGPQYQREEQHKFYRILAGELDNYGRPVDDGEG